MRRQRKRAWLRALTTGAAVLVGLLWAVARPVVGQRPPGLPQELPLPRPEQTAPANQSTKVPQPPPGATVAVTLVDVLRLATLANLDIEQARLIINRAAAANLLARGSFLPNLNVGSTYVHHEGQIQNTAGNVITVDRDSLFVGGGPSLNWSLTDALFNPQATRRVLDSTVIRQARVTNDVLLAVADAYLAVLRARRHIAAIDEALDFVTSEQPRRERGNYKGLLPLLRIYVAKGFASPSDLARLQTDVILRNETRAHALEELRFASATLARLLHMDPTVFLLPGDDYRNPIKVPAEHWCAAPLEDLVAQGLRNRPELAENRALIDAALVRLRAANWRPLLPNVVLNYNWGGFGGGPRVVGTSASGGSVLGNSGYISNFDTRSDFDVSLIWRVQNMGVGNLAEKRDRRYEYEQFVVTQLQLQDRVATQVVQAFEQVQQAAERVRICREGLFGGKGESEGVAYRSIRLNFLRLVSPVGERAIPLEVLDSIRRLGELLDAYGVAQTDYDRARFYLLIALGLPPYEMLNPAVAKLPPASAGPKP